MGSYMLSCTVCKIHAHSVIQPESMFQNITELRGKSCFEIYHSVQCRGLWGNGMERTSVSTGHPIYIKLLQLYGLGHTTREKGKKFEKGKV